MYQLTTTIFLTQPRHRHLLPNTLASPEKRSMPHLSLFRPSRIAKCTAAATQLAVAQSASLRPPAHTAFSLNIRKRQFGLSALASSSTTTVPAIPMKTITVLPPTKTPFPAQLPTRRIRTVPALDVTTTRSLHTQQHPTKKARKPKAGCEIANNDLRPHVAALDRLRIRTAPHAQEISATFHASLPPDAVNRTYAVLLGAFAKDMMSTYASGLL